MILINPMVKHDILASDAQTKVLRPAIQDWKTWRFWLVALLVRCKSHSQTRLEVLTMFKSASIERLLITMKLSFLSIIIISVDLFDMAACQVHVSTDGAESTIVIADLDNQWHPHWCLYLNWWQIIQHCSVLRKYLRTVWFARFHLPARREPMAHIYRTSTQITWTLLLLVADGLMDIIAAANWLPHQGPTLFVLYSWSVPYVTREQRDSIDKLASPWTLPDTGHTM
jgi:hypothetical protein